MNCFPPYSTPCAEIFGYNTLPVPKRSLKTLQISEYGERSALNDRIFQMSRAAKTYFEFLDSLATPDFYFTPLNANISNGEMKSK